tara:strand:+ start:6085 stop:7026 length:942 start_codon:yes stop_codon:yes gene_type:complete
MLVSVVIPTHNPNASRLEATLEALCAQNFPERSWELIVVNNASSNWLSDEFVATRAPANLQIIQELNLGLSFARQSGILASNGSVVVLSDDDNVLAPDYLEQVVSSFDRDPGLGMTGGKSIPIYAQTPPDWFVEGMAPLGCRDLGDRPLVMTGDEFRKSRSYPLFAPIGAGMAFRKSAVNSWMASVGKSGISDRKGNLLSSAGDCDMVLHALSSGWNVSYQPKLSLQHLIPAERLAARYLANISRCATRDFIRVLAIHGIVPWEPMPSWTLPFRKLKAWVKCRPWSSNGALIDFNSRLGHYEARATLRSAKSV